MIDRQELLENISMEVNLAKVKYPKFNSLHEGYAVILEEIDELRDEAENQGIIQVNPQRCPLCELWALIKASKDIRHTPAMEKECIQIAAMAIRFIEDLQP